MSALRGNAMQYGCLIPTIYPTGVFIQSIEQTKTSTEAGGKNIITVTLTNHTQQRFEILNGAKGDPGDAASIKEITASIDNGVGTPSVTVTSTGTGVEKTVHFDFKNLKGETGNVALTEEVKQHISQSVASANQYTDSAIGAIEQRIDTGDTNTLQTAEKHADQTVQAEAQARTKGDADTLKSAKDYTDGLLIKIFQNGYVQWPWMPKPETVFSFKGYRWAEVNYDGCFFRAKGKGANPFNGEEQSDAIRNITGSFGTQGNDKSNTADGAFYPKKRGRTDGGYSEGTNWLNEVGLDLTKIKGFPTASENRSRNRTFIIWQLKKI